MLSSSQQHSPANKILDLGGSTTEKEALIKRLQLEDEEVPCARTTWFLGVNQTLTTSMT